MAKTVQKGKPAKKAVKPVKKAVAKKPAKKAPAKKAVVPAKKTTPKKAVKKVVSKKVVKKVTPKKATKPAKKLIVKKPVSKVTAKKATPKKIVKPIKKAVAKKSVKEEVVKKVAKPAKKLIVKKEIPKKNIKKAAAKKIEPKKAIKPVKKEVPKPVEKKPLKTAEKKAPKAEKVKTPKPGISDKKVTAAAKKREEDSIDLEEDIVFDEPPAVEYKTPSVRKPLGPIPTPHINTDKRTRYTDPELKEFKQLILKKLGEAQKDYELLKSTLSHRDDHGTDDTSPTFKLLEDGSDVLSKEETAHLAGRQEKFIQNLQNALIRIENKTYGICRQTGKLISKERLRSVPHATLAIEAKLDRK